MAAASSGPDRARSPRTWRTPLRLALRFGLPLVGIAVAGGAVVDSIGGDISRARFALAILLVALSVSARLVPGR
ncbi:hypothetical protein [Methylobacterium nigriterrae]|uniref:hypothetical protein n=1 Tax=Methylobacterium nigriterrae TaxID=3127512 RepID=UPI00301366D6